LSKILTSPELGFSSPIIILAIVLFPEPLSPITARHLPFSISKENEFKTSCCPYFFTMLISSIAFI